MQHRLLHILTAAAYFWQNAAWDTELLHVTAVQQMGSISDCSRIQGAAQTAGRP